MLHLWQIYILVNWVKSQSSYKINSIPRISTLNEWTTLPRAILYSSLNCLVLFLAVSEANFKHSSPDYNCLVTGLNWCLLWATISIGPDLFPLLLFFQERRQSTLPPFMWESSACLFFLGIVSFSPCSFPSLPSMFANMEAFTCPSRVLSSNPNGNSLLFPTLL